MVPLLAPVPMTSVAAVAVMNNYGQILVGFNKKRQVWDIPQGVVEAGEQPITAAARELEEETGIQARAELLEPVAKFKHKTVEFVYPFETTLYMLHGTVVAGAENKEPGKCDTLVWMAPAQLPHPRGLSLRILLDLIGRG